MATTYNPFNIRTRKFVKKPIFDEPTESAAPATKNYVDNIIPGSTFVAFGAIGNGVTDDTAAVQSAFNSSASQLDGQGKTYRITSTLNIPGNNRSIRNATFDFSSLNLVGTPNYSYIIPASGVIGPAFNLNANATIGLFDIVTTNPFTTADFNSGDYVFIESNAVYSTTGATFGELQLITSVNTGTNTITLDEGVHLPYMMADTARVSKITFSVGFEFYNVSIIGFTAGMTTERVVAIDFTNTRRARITNCNIRQVCGVGVEFNTSWDCVVDSCAMYNIVQDLAYGVSFVHGCSHCKVTSCHFDDCRHGCTSGGTIGVCYCMEYSNNSASGCGDAAFDFHPAVLNGRIIGNTVTAYKGRPNSGNADVIVLQGANMVCSKNIITGCPDYVGIGDRIGIFAQCLVVYSSNGFQKGSFTVTDNIINNCDLGIDLRNQGAGILNNVVVSGNSINDYHKTCINVHGITDSINNAIVTGNTIHGTQAFSATTITAIFVRSGPNFIRSVNVSNNTITGYSNADGRGITVFANAGSTGFECVTVTGNTINHYDIGVVITSGTLIGTLYVTNNVLNDTTSAISFVTTGVGAKRVIEDNTLITDNTVTDHKANFITTTSVPGVTTTTISNFATTDTKRYTALYTVEAHYTSGAAGFPTDYTSAFIRVFAYRAAGALTLGTLDVVSFDTSANLAGLGIGANDFTIATDGSFNLLLQFTGVANITQLFTVRTEILIS
jgi:hypothetical protein